MRINVATVQDALKRFLLRDAMRKARSLLSSGVRPSVDLSRWRIVLTRLKISSNFILGPLASSF